jgi:hypothetical protein
MGQNGPVLLNCKEEYNGNRLVSQFTRRAASHGKNIEHGVCASGQARGIPQSHITQLANDESAAAAILDKVKGGERTAADVVQRNKAFKGMETEARFIKKHFLLVPSLTLADLLILLLSLPDNIHTPVPLPSGQPTLTITYPGGPIY